METEKEFSFIMACPSTGKQLTKTQHEYSWGICPHCGHNNNSTFTHEKKIVGKWTKPTFLHRLLGTKSQFIRN